LTTVRAMGSTAAAMTPDAQETGEWLGTAWTTLPHATPAHASGPAVETAVARLLRQAAAPEEQGLLGSVTATATGGLLFLEWVESHYLVLDYGAVARFLFTNPQLGSVLIELPNEAGNHFGSPSTVMLDVACDDEAPKRCRLYATIVTARSSADALARLDTLYESWWLDRLPLVAGKLNLGIRHLL